MKVRFWVILIFSLLLFTGQAQTIITGQVTDLKNTPIPNATVYLSKTTVGVLANTDGIYSLSIPQVGTYELIASCVGYESHTQRIRCDGTAKKINIKLPERIILISEVTVKGKDINRKQNYETFLYNFIGRTQNAPFCKIRNQKDLIIYRSSNDSNLIAYSTKPLLIEHSTFGYKIIYDLRSFNYNLKTRHLRFSGDYYYQDITNKNRENSRIKRTRLVAYYGSRMHFLRALFTDSVSQENFKIYNTAKDSISKWWLTSKPIQESDLRLATNSDSMTLYNPTPIEIKYAENHPELFPLPFVYRPGESTSRMYFSDTIHVYKNGYYPDLYNISWGGNMARDRIAELLPYDFVPKSITKKGSSLLK